MTFATLMLPIGAITAIALIITCAVIDYRNAKEDRDAAE